MTSLLKVDHLTVGFPVDGRQIEVVRDISFAIGTGEFVGLVGESGSGKSMSALAVLRLIPPPGRILTGTVDLQGIELTTCGERQLRGVRGARIAMVFQEPMTALNPVLTIGFQIAEAIRAHSEATRIEAAGEAERLLDLVSIPQARHERLLDLVSIPQARQRLKDYPHQLSGGQRQRAMIAMALAAEPELLIADEPTTALDVTIQAQILELLERLRQELGLAVLLITHDLAVVAETCDRALVMYAGRIVEEAPIDRLFATPAHPYTRGLLAAIPGIEEHAVGEDLPTIPGQIPDPAELPPGCAFHPRCDEVMGHCSTADPHLYALGDDRSAACFLYDDDGERHATG